jgi:hypothetical protein
MKRTLFFSFIIIFTISFLSLVGCHNQNIIKEQSSLSGLQEQCVNRSKEYFKKEYGNGMINGKNGERLISKYANHYNKKLNKCYILITSTELIRNKENKIENIRIKTLFELNENKEYGSLIKFENNNELINCRILEKYCNLEKEWNLVIKPYMEE